MERNELLDNEFTAAAKVSNSPEAVAPARTTIAPSVERYAKL
jgi:hypothetical protein